MRQFKARREPRSGTKTFFEHGRDEYLAAKVVPWVEPRRFCNALEEIHAPLGPLYKRSGYPWITLVLGSGCLEAGHDISGTRIRDVPAIVQRLLADADPLPDGTNAAKLAGAFAASLIADRLGLPASRGSGEDGEAAAEEGDPRPQAGDSFDTTTDLKTAKLLLCAALLTRLYHLASAAAPDALSRTGHDRVSLPIGRAGSAELETDALQPVLVLLEELISSAEENGHDSGDAVLHQALTTIDSSLSPRGHQPSLRVGDIQLLTELCWYSLTQGTSVYPGWNDLLLHLSTRSSPALFDRWLPRPAFDDIDAACQFVEQRYAATTRLSWTQLEDDDQTDRERFYATVAAVLRQQAALREGFLQSSPLQPPIASAFVTSFDLELEMAMWRSSTEPFVVAVPMNLLQDVAEPATCLAVGVLAGVPDPARPRPDPLRAAGKAAHAGRGGLVPAQRRHDVRTDVRQLPGGGAAQRIAPDAGAAAVDRGRQRLERPVPAAAEGLPHRAAERAALPHRARTADGARGPAR